MHSILKAVSGIGSLLVVFALSTPAQARYLGLGEVVRELGGATDGNRCAFNERELTKMAIKDPTLDISAHWACHEMDDINQWDSLVECLPAPKMVFSTAPKQLEKVDGIFLYAYIYNGPYRYELAPLADGGTLVKVRVGFYGDPAEDQKQMDQMRKKLADAADIWTKSAPSDLNVRFEFTLVERKDQANFFVEIQEKLTRGPYNRTWSTQWTTTTIAHEVGHMMGLDDEYNQFRTSLGLGKTAQDRLRCNLKSLMCNSRGGKPQKYHYYSILRRQFCSQPDPGEGSY